MTGRFSLPRHATILNCRQRYDVTTENRDVPVKIFMDLFKELANVFIVPDFETHRI